MLAPEGCGTEKPAIQCITTCRLPLPAFNGDAQTSTKYSTNTSIYALKVLLSSALYSEFALDV